MLGDADPAQEREPVGYFAPKRKIAEPLRRIRSTVA
jgi:hypothetical protein